MCSDLEGEAGRQLGELVAHELALTGAQLGIALEHVINRFLQPVLNGVQRLLVLQHHFHHCLLPLQNGLFSKFQNKRNERVFAPKLQQKERNDGTTGLGISTGPAGRPVRASGASGAGGADGASGACSRVQPRAAGDDVDVGACFRTA